MQVTLEIPDDIVQRFNLGDDLSRRALELLALEEYKNGHLTEAELQKVLGFGTRHKLDGFLKEHDVMIEDYTTDDPRREVATLQRLGF